ncbi:MAG TPA: HEAT repeat domain-containing protein [Gemmataceae bacterium]|nr:HEAT repeat domain-containing protein [Gemmataceae bacterium]
MSGSRLLRVGWILLGTAFLGVFLFALLTIFMVKFRNASPANPAEQVNAQSEDATPSTDLAPSAKDNDSDAELLPLKVGSTEDNHLARTDEVDRILGGGLQPPPAPPPLPASAPRPSIRPDNPPPLPPAPELPAPPKPADVPPSPPAKPQRLAADVAFEKRLQASEDDLRQQLLAVPELRLFSDLEIESFRAMEKKDERAVRGVPRSQIDYTFNLRLNKAMRQAALKSGLSLLSGPKCQLDPASATIVQTLSKNLRDMGFVSVPVTPVRVRFRSGKVANVAGTTNLNGSPKEKIEAFKEWCDVNKVEKFRGALATLLQMLQVEDDATRLLLVRELAKVNNAAATAALAKRGLVDLSPEVRQAAVAALQKRPAAQYVPILLQGLRYPWAPVADHAAVALLTLKPEGAVPKLVDVLDKLDPSVPVLDPKAKKGAVPELVRLNHMRNCLLCHAPSMSDKDGLVRGLVPTPGQPLPRLYYAGQTGNFVRADITFLRQDFSVNLPVMAATPWPNEQRFDFVTRVRPVKADEMPEITQKPTGQLQREAVLYALRGLTGKDGGDSTAKWRDMLGITTGKPAVRK